MPLRRHSATDDERDPSNTTVYASVEEMKLAPRHYTGEQAEAIRRTVANRKPLPEPPLPLEDDPSEGTE